MTGQMRGEQPLATLSKKMNKPIAQAIQRAERNGPLPLSYAQQRLWFLDQLEPQSPVYNVPSAVRLCGELNVGALTRSINEIVRRHEALRTRFPIIDGTPAQEITEAREATIHCIDLSLKPENDRRLDADRIAAEERIKPFDLVRGPLIRTTMLKMGEREHLFLITMHHIVVDGLSIEVMLRELASLYKAYRDGKESPLKELKIQYADFSVWQRIWLRGETLERSLSYWKTKLEGASELELPTDYVRLGSASHQGAIERFWAPENVAQALKAISRKEGVTLFMTLLAAFKALLARYSGQDDVIVGVDLANRNRPETKNLIGFFVNQLALRTDLSGNPSFRGLLKRVSRTALEAYGRQDLPFEKLVAEIVPERDLSRSPFFRVKMALQHTPQVRFELDGLDIEVIEQDRGIAKIDLELIFREVNEGLEIDLEYAVDLFAKDRIKRLAEHICVLLKGIEPGIERPISELSLLSDREKAQIVEEWNQTKAFYPTDRCVHEYFEQWAEQTPEAIALVYGDRRLTYGELNARANQLANYLRRMGVEAESLVGIRLERSLEMMVSLLGILKAGGAYVPLDTTYPAERVRMMLEDAHVRALLTHQHLPERTAANGAQVVCPDRDWSRIEAESRENPPKRTTADNAAYVIYTSGSTGRPKGVLVAHDQVSNFFSAMDGYLEPGPADVWLAVTSVSFDISVLELLWTLGRGCQVVIQGEAGTEQPTSEWAGPGKEASARLSEDESVTANLVRGQITHLQCTPSMAKMLGLEKESGEGLRSLRKLLIGGEAFPARLAEELKGMTKAEIFNMYGPTETTIWSSTHRLNGEESPIPIGRPIANTQIYILDGRGDPAPIGAPGELTIGGKGVAPGYLKRPELTAARFTPDPLSPEPGTRAYRTGDLARYRADGKIEFLGRADHQVKIRGYRIELGEVEAQLSPHPSIEQCVVLARGDETEEKRLIAYAVCKGERTPSASEMRGYLKDRLPAYMLPAGFVWLEQMPLTPNGKLDRRALPEDGFALGASREYEAPVGALEIALARIWAETLKLELVGRNDNFFELGGHSLLAVKLIERMRREGLTADLYELFASPTLAALAAVAGNGRGEIIEVPPNRIPQDCEVITPDMLPLATLSVDDIERIVASMPGGAANVQDVYPLAPLQEGILFHYLMESEGDPYLLHGVYRFDNRDRLNRFLQAMQKVIDRHDILRTAVFWEGLPEPMQVVLRKAPLIVEEINHHHAMGETAEQLLASFNPRRFRIDIRQAPMMRMFVIYDARQDCWVMLHLFHHLLGDHTALGVLLEEIQARLLNRMEPPPPLQFRNFVAQARLGISRQEHIAFFQEMLGDVDEPTAPFGLINVQGDGAAIKEARREIDGRLARRLRNQARELGVSPAALFHLAWALVLARTSGRSDVVFGTVLFGRLQGADRAPGMFINTLPIRIRVDGGSVRELLHRTQASLAELLRHEHAPLALAQRCSRVAAPAPLFSALLNYRHSGKADSTAESAGSGLRAWAGIQFLSGEERTNYPFNLSVDDQGDGFLLTAQAHASVEPDRVCDYLSNGLTRLAEALEDAPETPLNSLEILSVRERHQSLAEWNATEAVYPDGQCIHTLFEAQAAGTPDAVAVADEDRQLSFQGLNARANQLARKLLSLGAAPETRVAILLDRSLELALAELAVLKCGAAYVPLDRNAPVERQNLMIEDCQASLVLTVEDREQPTAVDVQYLNLAMLKIEDQPAHDLGLPLGSETPAYIMYTSGSTGQPKGVVIPHRAIGRLALNNGYAAFDSGDNVAFTSNPAFDASTMEVWAPLLHGGRLVVIPQSVLLEPNRLLDLLNRQQVNILHLVAGLLGPYAGPLSSVISKLRYLMTGGDVVDPSAVADILRQSPPRRLIHCYGPSESTTFAATHEVCEIPEGARSIPIGGPIANTQIYLLDQDLQLVPTGATGELYVGGKGLAHGYLGRSELTAERFTPDLYTQSPGARLYRTGDLARRRPDGTIEFLGRIDHQVKIRGFRVELGEIEALLSSHPAVKQCVVLVHQAVGEEKRLAAYAVPEGDSPPSAGEMRRYLKERAPAYMLPSWFVWLEQIPLTPNGKVDRKELAALEIQKTEERERYVAPRTLVEEILTGIFEEVLARDRVGIHDDFFEIGGHSLLATQVISRVGNTFKVDLEIRIIFEASSVAKLAEALIELEPQPGQIEKIALIYTKLNRMTDEELAALNQGVNEIPNGYNSQSLF